ncbi:histidine kinase dimerization/phosphoacceptor domain -containing protein [Flammeovirga aprica]|uniref:histidine kinase n=1 Tax=Flammeovirga aprica JL-4 TaxID=694437 RepID=A0A7X9RXB2_9BACT|nr:histidine kinase dimerization/phosphoacceptor domain -containing protein [Flammeovirga aprica]NME70384.1 tetratricopeptide repeat protein [Flammeovirga aprica JL-4]
MHKAIEITKKTNNLELQSKILENISNIHRLLGNKVKAINYILQAIEINKEFNNRDLEALNYSQLANIYYSDKDYIKAKEYYEKALAIFPKNFQDNSKASLLNYMMLILNTGDTYRILKDYTRAINSFTEVLSLNEATKKNEIIFGYAHGNLGMAQMSIQQTFEAEKNLKLGVHYLKRVGDHLTAEIFRVELGKLRLQEKNEEYAETIFLSAYKRFKSLHAKEQIRDISELLASFYEEIEQLDKALFYERENALYRDSLINKETIKKMEQGKHQIEINEMEHEMDLLRQEAIFRGQTNKINLAIIVVILMFLAYFFVINLRRKKSNAKLQFQKNLIAGREIEKEVLLKELNHRVKNNLQMISSLLNLQSRKLGDHPAVKAIDSGRFRVEAMSLIHQKLYQTELHSEIAIENYIEELVLNLCYSFDAPFTPEFNTRPVMLHIDKAIPMGLIINEFVTNAMKYAFDGIKEPQLKIHLRESDNKVIIKVIDNGVGLNSGKSTGTNFGLNLVDSLVKQLDGNISFEIGRGTTCILVINK